jgi:hypothetical protein
MRKTSGFPSVEKTLCFATFGCFLSMSAAFAAEHPLFGGTWKLIGARSNFGSFKGPSEAIDHITQTNEGITLNRDRDGDNTITYIPLDSSSVTLTNSTKMIAHWDADSLVFDFTSTLSGRTTHAEERWSLSRNGTILKIYYKGSQGARMSILMGRQ